MGWLGWVVLSVIILLAVTLSYLLTLFYLNRKTKPRVSESSRIFSTRLDTEAALVLAIDAKDHDTLEHSQTVSRLAVQIARELGLSDSLFEGIRLAGLFHDIGKIGIPDAVLFKRSSLTPEEFETMKTHTLLGAKFLESYKLRIADWIRMNVRNHHEAFDSSSYEYSLEAISATVRHHHEAFDGSGYPDHLRGENIPLAARIVAVAESFDNMVSELPYRRGHSTEDAVAELRRCSGTQFDPKVVDVFLSTPEDTWKKIRAETALKVGPKASVDSESDLQR
jgi:putative nucleotidyltransferase with HDIG domain